MLPFNIASYALLAHIIGKLTNMIPTRLIGDLSNVHLYENSWKASEKLLKRDPLKYDLPQLLMLDEFHYLTDKNIAGKLSVEKIISELRIDMFILKNYQSYPNIPVEMLAPKN